MRPEYLLLVFFIGKNEGKTMNDVFESKDKQIVPFLFTQSDIKFLGTRLIADSLYFQFSPLQRCTELVNAYVMKKAPLVQAKDLLDAIESYRDMVFGMKEKRKSYGRF